MLIERKEYLDKLLAWKDKQLIKVITGVRRCGKSTLMEMFQSHLKRKGVEEKRILSVNFEDYDFYDLRDPAKLYAYIKDRLDPNVMNYIFLDEVQHVADFPRVVDSLYIKKNIDLYLTGSNAYMLSGEIATLLSGRYVEISMLPLSFREYVESTGSTAELGRKYADYLQNSSFPYTLELRDNAREIKTYLDAIYNTVVVKDIAARKKISDTLMLESVTRFLFDNIGNPLSSKKIADTLTSAGRKIDVKTVEKMIEGLTESFILYRAGRYNVKGKQYLKTMEKYYAVDIGLRYALLGSRNADVGHILEKRRISGTSAPRICGIRRQGGRAGSGFRCHGRYGEQILSGGGDGARANHAAEGAFAFAKDTRPLPENSFNAGRRPRRRLRRHPPHQRLGLAAGGMTAQRRNCL